MTNTANLLRQLSILRKYLREKRPVGAAGGEKEKMRNGSHQQHYLLFESLESPSPPLVPSFHFKGKCLL